MTEPPKRRWFQLHLSTCVVMTLIAAVFLYVAIQDHLYYRPYFEIRDGSWKYIMSQVFKNLLGIGPFMLGFLLTTILFEWLVRIRDRNRQKPESPL